jgi:hypothetical protein
VYLPPILQNCVCEYDSFPHFFVLNTGSVPYSLNWSKREKKRLYTVSFRIPDGYPGSEFFNPGSRI